MNSLPASRRDQQIRRIATNLRKAVPHLNRPEFTPMIRGFAMVTLTLERSYAALRDKDPISPTTQELRSSVDVIGRLAAHQAKLAAQLGLSPVSLQALKKTRADDHFGAAIVGAQDDADR